MKWLGPAIIIAAVVAIVNPALSDTLKLGVVAP